VPLAGIADSKLLCEILSYLQLHPRVAHVIVNASPEQRGVTASSMMYGSQVAHRGGGEKKLPASRYTEGYSDERV